MLSILLTRPKEIVDDLKRKLEAAGITCVLFPTIEIVDANPTDQKIVKSYCQKIADIDILIFISPAAVIKLSTFIQSLPKTVSCFAIGEGTANFVECYGFGKAQYPEQHFHREALLAMPGLAELKDKKVMICQGESTDETIYKALKKRGASVFLANLYRRRIPKPKSLPDLHRIDIVQCTSLESMKNLVTLFGPPILSKKLLVSSDKLKAYAKTLGFNQEPMLANSAFDEAILHTLTNIRV